MRYEYRVAMPEAGILTASDLQLWLNEIAYNGWRLVAVHNGMFIFEQED
jgi:hypothetical protein